MMRFSLMTLLAILSVLAICLAAILYPNIYVATFFSTAMLVLVLFGISAAKICGGGARAYWVGFSVFGGSYLLFSSIFSSTIGSLLITDHLLRDVHRWLRDSGWHRYEPVGYKVMMHVGHSVFAIVFALAGGMMANWLYRRGGSTRADDFRRGN
jgi:hypothetical protein